MNSYAEISNGQCSIKCHTLQQISQGLKSQDIYFALEMKNQKTLTVALE